MKAWKLWKRWKTISLRENCLLSETEFQERRIPFYWFKASSEEEVEEEEHAELAPTKQSRPRIGTDKKEELIEVFQRQADRVGGPKLFSDDVFGYRTMIEHADFIRDVFATGGLFYDQRYGKYCSGQDMEIQLQILEGESLRHEALA